MSRNGGKVEFRRVEAPGMEEATEGQLSPEGLWPAWLPDPDNPQREEYCTGRDGLRILRISGIAHHSLESSPYLESLQPGKRLLLVGEPANHYDKNAVAVLAREDGHRAGYVPRSLNEELPDWPEEMKAWMLCFWVDPAAFVMWDGPYGGGECHLVFGAHMLVLDHPPLNPFSEEPSVVDEIQEALDA